MSKNISNFLDEHGRITTWPSDRRSEHQRAILEQLRSVFEAGYQYTSQQAQRQLEEVCSLPDLVAVLDTLLEAEYLDSDGQYYWRSDARPKQLWPEL